MFSTIRRMILTVVMATSGLLLLAPIARVAWAQNVYNTTYFDTDPNLNYPIKVGGLPTFGNPKFDNTVRFINPTFHTNQIVIPSDTPGSNGGGLCAMIYVFDDDQQPIECCGCPISNDGTITLSVEDDLTASPATGLGSPPTTATHGVIQVISALPNTTTFPFCDPTGLSGPVVPEPTIREWITHEPREHEGPTPYPPFDGTNGGFNQNLTEEEFLWAALSAQHLADLQKDCSEIVTNGTFKGVCTCGTDAENPAETGSTTSITTITVPTETGTPDPPA